MKQLKYSQQAIALDMNKVLIRLSGSMKILKPMDVVSAFLALFAFTLWAISLKSVDLRHMTDLGLVSVLPPSLIIALVIMMVSFCLALRRPQVQEPILLLHLVLLIFMLFGVTALVEQSPNISTVYKHAGYTEYIMRTGSVKPDLDTYFNWPGFFILSALVTQIAGYHSALDYAAWSPVFFNLSYLGPLYIIFTTATTNKRMIWLALWFFSLTNWIQQDAFLPQALNFFLYLVIIAILLKWFIQPLTVQANVQMQRWPRFGRFSFFIQKLYAWLRAPDILYTPSDSRQRVGLIAILIVIFLLSVFSHLLTPFFLIASVTALVVFRLCRPFWLPILMVVMTAAWILIMAQAFLVGHTYLVTGDVGHIGSAVSSNVTARVAQGSPEHIFIAKLRVYTTAAIWGLALLGGILRLRKGYRDITYILLATVPFPLLVAQSYGGEMLLRIYLFTLPIMVFFAAVPFSIEFTRIPSKWVTGAVIGTSIVLLSCFLFTRYGNENMDYISTDEVTGIHYLYNIAPSNSLFLPSEDNGPLQYQNFEKYSYYSLSDTLPGTIESRNVSTIIHFLAGQKYSNAYLIFTRSQKAEAHLLFGLPSTALDQFEIVLKTSGKFKLIYNNPDVQIFQYVQ